MLPTSMHRAKRVVMAAAAACCMWAPIAAQAEAAKSVCTSLEEAEAFRLRHRAALGGRPAVPKSADGPTSVHPSVSQSVRNRK